MRSLIPKQMFLEHRILAIGDIHGCSRALDALLRAVAPTEDDVIVTLGDYVDRGGDSSGVIDRLTQLSTSNHLVPLRGNHEEMMIDARRGPELLQIWQRCGGNDALRSAVFRASRGMMPSKLSCFHAG